MTTTPKKPGRKAKPFRCYWDNDRPVHGLYHMPDRRWRLNLGKGNPLTGHRFTEPDDRLAIAKFFRMTGGSQIQQMIGQPGPIFTKGKPTRQGKGLVLTRVGPGVGTATLTKTPDGFVPTGPKSGTEAMPINLDCPEVWAFVRQQILERPKHVAQQTGIEQISYLTDLKAPEAWPTMADVGKAYTDRTDISPRELHKCGKTWKDFTRTTAAETLHDLSPEIIARWGQKLRQSGLGPKSIKHAIGRVRTILHYYLTTGKGLEHVRRAIDACRVLRTPEALCKDPKPISPAHLNALLKVAQGEERAMLLVALNLALYAVDVAALEWSAFDMAAGTFTQRRGKTKVPRVGCLWPATLKALKAIKVQDDDRVFHTSADNRHSANTVIKLFAVMRKRAEIPADGVKFAGIRDGAFTAACNSTGGLTQSRLIAGHSTGMSDAYVLRSAASVKDACKAIARTYGIK